MGNDKRNCATLIIGYFLISSVSSDPGPLNFEFSADNPLKARIYLNPLASIKKVRELASREVVYTENNVTKEVEEETGEWYTLIADDDNVSPRFALIKNERCNQKDFRVTWLDEKDHLHSNVLQRLGPSPTDFPANDVAKIRASHIHFDQDKVIVHLEYPSLQEIISINPKRFIKPGNLTPVVQLDTCMYLFDNPQRQPILSEDKKSVTFDIAYADHFCTFSVHLSILSFDRDKECFEMLQTSGDKSDKIDLKCGEKTNHPCPKVKQQSQSPNCKPDCDLALRTVADYKYPAKGSPYPVVKLEWSPKSKSNTVPKPTRVVAKITEIGVYFNNFALGDTNSTTYHMNESFFELKSAQKKDDTLYAVRACQIEAQECPNFEPDWNSVPQYAVFSTKLIRDLGPFTTTTPTTKMTSPSTGPNSAERTTDKSADNSVSSKRIENSEMTPVVTPEILTTPENSSEGQLNQSSAASPAETPSTSSKSPVSKEKGSGSGAVSQCMTGLTKTILAALILLCLTR